MCMMYVRDVWTFCKRARRVVCVNDVYMFRTLECCAECAWCVNVPYASGVYSSGNTGKFDAKVAPIKTLAGLIEYLGNTNFDGAARNAWRLQSVNTLLPCCHSYRGKVQLAVVWST
jgi:hypothetical protein